MADITYPVFQSVSVVPNPVDTSQPLKILVVIKEVELMPDWFFSGEIFAGEDGI